MAYDLYNHLPGFSGQNLRDGNLSVQSPELLPNLCCS